MRAAERSHREKKKRRHRVSFDDDYDDEGGISGWKLGMVMGVIVVCFAMLYPTLFHPMLMGFLGRGQQPKPSINQQRPPIHPAMGGGPGPRHPGAHPSRPDMHPAMKMAQAQAESHSSGKGMFTFLLPLYTVGVVIFLLYTLFKSKNKKKRRRRHDGAYYDSEDDEDSEVDTRYGERFSKKKLRGLQERLRQTEEAMAKILEQLETVQNGGDGVDLEQLEQLDENATDAQKADAGLNERNEQYINDLEVALKEFQALSKEYDNAKIKKARGESELDDSEVDSDEEEVSDESEVEEPVPAKAGKKKERKNTTDEEDEKEQEELHKRDSPISEEGFDVDTALLNDSQPTRRRRKPKKI
ncbi:unnamed protein product [Caenorhabditis bovis]|uniref:Resistance to inhibitors of cholinesterase protein 3 N-terminal domain-containing protein n=1 Tax=Caenorhabditis bovis TaxID=2654633 RepID=A0A8S1EYY7_9PELO|nr:unnamed protein product [Caenorhabditis bovis]